MQALDGGQPSLEQALQQLARLQSILAQRGVQDVARLQDSLAWCCNLADAGSPEARQVLSDLLRTLKRAETSSKGIVL